MDHGRGDNPRSARGTVAKIVAEQPCLPAEAFEQLYAELRRLARRQLGRAPRTMLCTTARVHEAFLKLDGDSLDASRRGPFLALAAKAMRHVITDHVRECMAVKRGGGAIAVTLDTQRELVEGAEPLDLLTVEQGLRSLEQFDPRLVNVVECRFFAGMDFAEIGQVLGLSERTAQRDWRRARAFLQTRLADARA